MRVLLQRIINNRREWRSHSQFFSIFRTFRYGMVLLYIGTLLIVIGYHNSWVNFLRYFGINLVAIGLMFVGTASVLAVKRYCSNHVVSEEDVDYVSTISSGIDHLGRKPSLPTYENAVDVDLPSYEEAIVMKGRSDMCQTQGNARQTNGNNTETNDAVISLWPSIGHRLTHAANEGRRGLQLQQENIEPSSEPSETTINLHDGQIFTMPGTPIELLNEPHILVVSPSIDHAPRNENTKSNFSTVNLSNDVTHEHWSAHYEIGSEALRSSFTTTNLTNGVILAPQLPYGILPDSNISQMATYGNEIALSQQVCSFSILPNPDLYMPSPLLAPDTTESSQEVTYVSTGENHSKMNIMHENIPSQASIFPPRGDALSCSVLSASHQPTLTSRPHTSIKRPSTSANMMLESCSSSLYEDASFEENVSSESSDWDDDEMMSVTSITSPKQDATHIACNIAATSHDSNDDVINSASDGENLLYS